MMMMMMMMALTHDDAHNNDNIFQFLSLSRQCFLLYRSAKTACKNTHTHTHICTFENKIFEHR